MIPRLVVECLDDGTNWRVVEDAVWIDSKGRAWHCPANTITDFASIPRPFWPIVGAPANGLYRKIAPFHDVAYRTPGVRKADADLMLREGAIACGCPVWLADIIYMGVDIGGESSFTEDQLVAAAKAGALSPAV